MSTKLYIIYEFYLNSFYYNIGVIIILCMINNFKEVISFKYLEIDFYYKFALRK